MAIGPAVGLPHINCSCAGVVDAKAVRADQPRTGRGDLRRQRDLVGDPCRDPEESAHATVERVVDHGVHVGRGDAERNQVGHLGQIRNACRAGMPKNGARAGVDEVHPAAVRAQQCTRGQPVAPLRRVFGGADDGDRCRGAEDAET
jgi:hypothetical protein